MLRASLLVATMVASAFGDYQFTSGNWTRVAYCNTRRNSSLDMPLATLRSYANSATRVRICQAGSATDCVTSSPNSFPIVNLRAGQTIVSADQPNSCCANAQCLTNTWTGPQARVHELMWSCTGGCANRQPAIGLIYQACGNQFGLHFSVSTNYPGGGPTALCSWGASNGRWDSGGGTLELFIDYYIPPPTSAPTTPTPAPTSAPSPWYDNPNSPNSTSLSLEISQLRSQISTMSTQMSQQMSVTNAQLSTTTSNVLANEISIATTMALQDGMTNNYTALLGVLSSAVASSTFPASSPSTVAPRVGATANNGLAITAADSVQVSSGSCVAQDLCTSTSFAQAVRQALVQFLNQ